MKNYFECHITLLGNKETIKNIVESTGWKFSAIDGDPVLGDGVKCYATKQYPGRLDVEVVITNVKTLSNMYRELGIEVLRDKVENVVYDSKVFKIAG